MAKNIGTNGRSHASAEAGGNGADLHVVPKNGGWDVQVRGAVTSTHATRDQAVTAARSIAKGEGAEVLVHGQNGRVKHRLSQSRADEIMLGVWKRTAVASRRTDPRKD